MSGCFGVGEGGSNGSSVLCTRLNRVFVSSRDTHAHTRTSSDCCCCCCSSLSSPFPACTQHNTRDFLYIRLCAQEDTYVCLLLCWPHDGRRDGHLYSECTRTRTCCVCGCVCGGVCVRRGVCTSCAIASSMMDETRMCSMDDNRLLGGGGCTHKTGAEICMGLWVCGWVCLCPYLCRHMADFLLHFLPLPLSLLPFSCRYHSCNVSPLLSTHTHTQRERERERETDGCTYTQKHPPFPPP